MLPTTEAVLGVIRASRPQFRTAHDRVAFALHAVFLASGYTLGAAGPQAIAASSSGEDQETGVEGWNELDNAYAFRYFGGEADFVKKLEVKCTVINDFLMIDVAPAASESASDVVHAEIRVEDYAKETASGNYAQQYKDLDGLVKLLSSQVLTKCMKAHPAPPARDKGTLEEDGFTSSYGHIHPAGNVGAYRPPTVGSNDLMPGVGVGVFEPRRDVAFESGEAGNVVGPNSPIWGHIDPQARQAPGGILRPPGARYDPFGPSGVPGFEPGRFGRGGRGDLQHFPGL